MSAEQVRDLESRLEIATGHIVNLVNTITIDMEDVHSTDQMQALQKAEAWLKENL